MSKTETWTDIVTEQLAIVLFVPSKWQIKEFALKEDNLIGRTSSVGNPDIPIDSPVVSRKHGRIYLQDDYYFYEDLSSTNGTYINGILYGREAKTEKYKNLLLQCIYG